MILDLLRTRHQRPPEAACIPRAPARSSLGAPTLASLALLLALPACALLGVEPDEIDIATEGTEGSGEGTGTSASSSIETPALTFRTLDWLSTSLLKGMSREALRVIFLNLVMGFLRDGRSRDSL